MRVLDSTASAPLVRLVAAIVVILAAIARIRSAAPQATPWQPPIGIPAPPFGIVERAPAAPNPWNDATPGFYYVNAAAPGAADDQNPFGTPAKPRKTVPASLPPNAVVEIHGVYDRAHTSPNGIVAHGTATQPVYIRGASAPDAPSIVQAWEVSGSYFVLENLHFRDRDGTTTGSLVVLAPADHAAVRHCDISGNLKGGGLGIESWYGIFPATDIVVYDNKVHDNGDVHASFDQDRHGIHVGYRVNHVWVVDNELARNSGDGIQISARTKLLQPTTHHIYVGRNTAHHNKQNGFWVKQAVDVVFSQNVAYAHRPGNSSSGVGLGFQYAPSYVWFLFNHVFDSDYGIGTGSDSDMGSGTESFFIGNVIHDIHDSDHDFNPVSAWQNCGISLPGGVNRFVVNNTLYDVDSGICSPGATGRLELHNNIVFGIRRDGQHVFLEFPAVADATHARGNVFGPTYRALTGGSQQIYTREQRAQNGGNSVVRDAGLDLTPAHAFDLLPSSPAIDAGIDDPAGVYSLYMQRYSLDIRRDCRGRSRPLGRAYDAGACEWEPAGSAR